MLSLDVWIFQFEIQTGSMVWGKTFENISRANRKVSELWGWPILLSGNVTALFYLWNILRTTRATQKIWFLGNDGFYIPSYSKGGINVSDPSYDVALWNSNWLKSLLSESESDQPYLLEVSLPFSISYWLWSLHQGELWSCELRKKL